jgi:membrane protease YdiL (CAAX protease family)
LDPDLRRTLLTKLAPALLAIVVVLVVSRARRISWRDDLGLRAPRAGPMVLWLALWAGWVALAELVGPWVGLDPPSRWEPHSPLVLALRVATLGVVGPVAEELVARGLALDRLRRTRLRTWGAVALVSALWAAVHLQYGLPTILLVFLDGLLLGAARVHTRSLLPPIAMHVAGNLLAIWQSTHL